jgi:hypothetical protein
VKLARVWHQSGMFGTLTGNPVEPFIRHSGRIRERLKNMRQPLLPDLVYGGKEAYFSVWVQLYTSVESRKAGVPQDRTIQLFFLSIPMVV